MAGVTDWPFRRQAVRFGARYVVAEMTAGAQLAEDQPDAVRRIARVPGKAPLVIQLAGREEVWMARGAEIAQDHGADVIDINMGCPARQVTNGYSGSALMREPDHALRLIEAVVRVATVPVTLKMRLGWDCSALNAPDIARRAEAVGVRMIVVHGRDAAAILQRRRRLARDRRDGAGSDHSRHRQWRHRHGLAGARSARALGRRRCDDWKGGAGKAVASRRA